MASARPTDFDIVIIANNRRMIQVRWLVALLLLLATALIPRLLALTLPSTMLYGLGGFLLVCNGIFAGLNHQAELRPTSGMGQVSQQIAYAQVAVDWLALAAFLHLTGGLCSPATPAFLIHIVVVAVLLPGTSPYVYALAGLAVITGLAALEFFGWLPALPGLTGLPCAPAYALAQLAFFALTAIGTVYLTSSLVKRLRARERQIAALYETSQALTSTLALPELMSRLAQAAARALGMPSALIRLLDESGELLVMTASYGLSHTYLEKGPVSRVASGLDEIALSGQAVIVDKAPEDDRVQYPEEMAREGIGSMLAVPILGHSRPLGVMRIYSRETLAFDRADADFALAIARQGAVALENLLAFESLEKQDQNRAQFVRIVAHDLRSPVAASQSLLRTLAQGIAGDLNPTQEDILQRIEARMEALLHLIESLLAFAASKTPGLADAAYRLPLHPLLQKVIDSYQAVAEEKNVALTFSHPAEVCAILATEEGLVRIFDNLIGNAVKYTPTGGDVQVAVTERLDQVVITVSDTGIGISADDLPCIWDEFYRAPNARQAQVEGTGLGLAIVLQLVEQFGGEIGVKSEVGKGTAFRLSFPRLGSGAAT